MVIYSITVDSCAQKQIREYQIFCSITKSCESIFSFLTPLGKHLSIIF